MLRGLVLLFIGVNIVLFFWLGSDQRLGQSEREPQRRQHEVLPGSIQVLPDLPAGSTPAAASASATEGGAAPMAPVGASAASAGMSGGASLLPPAGGNGLARRTAAIELACLESGPLNAPEWNTLAGSLAAAGIPVDAISERDQHRPARWMIYMGRYTDPLTWQRKADELRRMNIRYERVSTPPDLDAGLSLGSYANAAEADARLADLARHGVHTARIVEEASEVVRHMQVHITNASWGNALPKGRFANCASPAGTSL
jgi:hypothetical protein